MGAVRGLDSVPRALLRGPEPAATSGRRAPLEAEVQRDCSGLPRVATGSLRLQPLGTQVGQATGDAQAATRPRRLRWFQQVTDEEICRTAFAIAILVQDNRIMRPANTLQSALMLLLGREVTITLEWFNRYFVRQVGKR